MTAASFKLRYAGAAILTALLSAAAVAALLMLRYQAEASALSGLATASERARVGAELQARAQSIAAHAAESIAGAEARSIPLRAALRPGRARRARWSRCRCG